MVVNTTASTILLFSLLDDPLRLEQSLAVLANAERGEFFGIGTSDLGTKYNLNSVFIHNLSRSL
jgi:hypothetical protein